MSAANVCIVGAKAPLVGGLSYPTTRPMIQTSAIGVTRDAGVISELFVTMAFPLQSLQGWGGEDGPRGC